jgi:hypothetical protein
MPNVAVPGWTKVPVAAKDLVQIQYSRQALGAATCNAEVIYEVRDHQGAVRLTDRLVQLDVNYPVSLAAILTACNSKQGT